MGDRQSFNKMKNYTNHLEQMYSQKSFGRKVDYIKYNFSEIFKDPKSSRFNVLEIGPGMGEFVHFLNEQKIVNIDVIDNDKSIATLITKKYKISNFYTTQKIAALENKLHQYNLIVMIQVLEHLPINQYENVLRTLYRHLQKNGFLVIVVPNGNNPLGLIERYADLQHYNCFTEQSLRDLINYSGIKKYEYKIKGYEIPPYTAINIVRIILQKILHLFLLLIMIINGGNYFKVMTPNIMLIIKKTS